MKGYNKVHAYRAKIQSRFSRKQSLKRKIFILYFRLLFSRRITPFRLVPPVTNHLVYFYYLCIYYIYTVLMWRSTHGWSHDNVNHMSIVRPHRLFFKRSSSDIWFVTKSWFITRITWVNIYLIQQLTEKITHV